MSLLEDIIRRNDPGVTLRDLLLLEQEPGDEQPPPDEGQGEAPAEPAPGPSPAEMEKYTKVSAGYREPAESSFCMDCQFFKEADSQCQLVDGRIGKLGTCDNFEPKQTSESVLNERRPDRGRTSDQYQDLGAEGRQGDAAGSGARKLSYKAARSGERKSGRKREKADKYRGSSTASKVTGKARQNVGTAVKKLADLQLWRAKRARDRGDAAAATKLALSSRKIRGSGEKSLDKAHQQMNVPSMRRMKKRTKLMKQSREAEAKGRKRAETIQKVSDTVRGGAIEKGKKYGKKIKDIKAQQDNYKPGSMRHKRLERQKKVLRRKQKLVGKLANPERTVRQIKGNIEDKLQLQKRHAAGKEAAKAAAKEVLTKDAPEEFKKGGQKAFKGVVSRAKKLKRAGQMVTGLGRKNEALEESRADDFAKKAGNVLGRLIAKTPGLGKHIRKKVMHSALKDVWRGIMKENPKAVSMSVVGIYKDKKGRPVAKLHVGFMKRSGKIKRKSMERPIELPAQ